MMNAVELRELREVHSEQTGFVPGRVSAALVAVTLSPRLRSERNSTISVVWNLVNNNCEWRSVLKSGVFWLVRPDPRLAVIPLAICDSLIEGSATHQTLRELCLGLYGEQFIRHESLAFSFLSALLIGYTIHREYDPYDHRNTREWLCATLSRYLPEVDKRVAEAELEKFRPFLETPNRRVELECPVEEAAVNTLVAVHERGVPESWKDGVSHQNAITASERMYAICRARRFAK